MRNLSSNSKIHSAKRSAIASILFFSATAIGMFGLYNVVTDRGIYVSNRTFQEGVVQEGKSIYVHVTLVNVSTRSVHLSVRPGCACTTTTKLDAVLKPFKSAQAVIKVDTSRLALGSHEKYLWFVYEDQNKLWTNKITVNFELTPSKPRARYELFAH